MALPELPALLTAMVLGVTHAVEPDHVAGIASVTKGKASPVRSAAAGAAFALGHVALVGVWVVATYFVLGRTSFPSSLDRIGVAVAGGVLTVLGVTMGVRGLRRLIHRHRHPAGEREHEHLHVHLPFLGGHRHGHSTGSYLKTGLVGALFTLSPPVSMIAFISVVVSTVTPETIVAAIAVYAVGITATMGLIGAGVGAAFNHLRERGERFHAVAQLVAATMVTGIGLYLLATELPGVLSAMP